MTIQVSCTGCGKTLQAKDSAAGKQAKCPDCGGIISIPEAVYDAIDEPGDDFGGGFDAEFDYAAAEHQSPTAPTGSQRRPCPQCGEMIVAGAAKCRFCGEIFDSRLRQQELNSVTPDAAKNLSAGDWVVAVLCSWIGCIAGIVWMIQGKPKGLKMFGISLGFTILWVMIRAAIEVGNL